MDQERRRPLRSGGLELRSNLTEGVGSLIFSTKTKRYLFLLRNSGSYAMTWGLPGGKLDGEERMDSALAREISEELGGYIKDAELILVERFVSPNRNFVYHTYFTHVDDEFVPALNDEHVGYAWLPLSAAPKPLHPGLIRTFGSEPVMKKIKIAESNC